MIEALKSLLSRAAQARTEGNRADAEALYKQAAEDAKAQDAVVRAEALMGTAQVRRDNGDRTGASIYLAEAITLLRNLYASDSADVTRSLAHALRHASEVRSELREYAVAGSHIQEAVRLYRSLRPSDPLALANALRVSALNEEREAFASWAEAEKLYAAAGVREGIEECRAHLDCLKDHDAGSGGTET